MFSIYTILSLLLRDNKRYIQTTSLPPTDLSLSITDLLLRCGYIQGYYLSSHGDSPVLSVNLRYYNNKPRLSSCLFISKPSRRTYVTVAWLRINATTMRPSDFVLSTDHGLISGSEAISLNVGGELVCIIK